MAWRSSSSPAGCGYSERDEPAAAWRLSSNLRQVRCGKLARAGAANKKIEYWLSSGMHQLLRLATKQDRRPANCIVCGHARACIVRRRPEFCVTLADERVRALGRFDTALACQPIEREQDRISRYAQMVGQLPRAWNVAARPQFSLRYQLADLVADLFVQRAIAPRFNLERNLNGGWTTNCGRGRESGGLSMGTTRPV